MLGVSVLRAVAGDTWVFSPPVDLAGFEPPYWSVRVVLSPESGGVPLAISATHSADGWTVTAPASETSTLIPGVWSYVVTRTSEDGSERFTSGPFRFTVDPDPTTHTGDRRSRNARILDAIEATIEGRATKDADGFTIEGRSITRTPVADLIRLRNIYRAEVRAERGKSAPFRVRRVTH